MEPLKDIHIVIPNDAQPTTGTNYFGPRSPRDALDIVVVPNAPSRVREALGEYCLETENGLVDDGRRYASFGDTYLVDESEEIDPPAAIALTIVANNDDGERKVPLPTYDAAARSHHAARLNITTAATRHTNPRKSLQDTLRQHRVKTNMRQSIVQGTVPSPHASISPDAESNSSDISRPEEKWTMELDNFLSDLYAQCTELSASHETYSRSYENKSRSIAIPGMILSLVAAGVNSFVSQRTATVYMLLSSFLGSMQTLYNLGNASQAHANTSSEYEELATNIRVTLSKERRNRDAADVTLQHFLNRFQYVELSAPSRSSSSGRSILRHRHRDSALRK